MSHILFIYLFFCVRLFFNFFLLGYSSILQTPLQALENAAIGQCLKNATACGYRYAYIPIIVFFANATKKKKMLLQVAFLVVYYSINDRVNLVTHYLSILLITFFFKKKILSIFNTHGRGESVLKKLTVVYFDIPKYLHIN